MSFSDPDPDRFGSISCQEPSSSPGTGRNRRRYVCADCGTAQTVGDGRRWRTVEELKQAGCPRCGGRVFRPRSRGGR